MGDRLDVRVDYSGFAAAAGADFGHRLRLVVMPACALTTPEKAQCRTQEPLRSSVNDGKSSQLTGSADWSALSSLVSPKATNDAGLAGEGFALAAVSGEASSQGDFAATSLAPSGTWTVSGGTGSFEWSYPVETPKAAGGLTPSVALEYSSSSVDGRIASTNNQTSWVGQGWDYDPGFIERTFRTCEDDPDGSDPDTNDLCWAGNIVTLSLNGKSTPLVRDDSTGDWRTASDDGTTVTRLAGAGNGVKDGEYWKVTTTDGTQYFFGRGGGPGRTTQAATQSAWAVPVFGSTPDSSCNTPSVTTSCSYGWRWNLDYVVDAHENAALYYYEPEENYYGPNKANTSVKYVRGGTLKDIEYGLRLSGGSVYGAPAQQKVSFTTAERCISSTFSCAQSDFTTANAAYWPDVPQDLDCNQGVDCTKHSPSFWSTRRLTGIDTYYRSTSGAWVKLDGYALTQSIPIDTAPPVLRFDKLVRTGYAADGSSLPVPPVSFAYVIMANRVDGFNSMSSMKQWRLTNLTTETGSTLSVAYTPVDCTATSVPTSPSANTRRCFPVYWTLPGRDPDTGKTLDYFHKYLVTKVTLGMAYTNTADSAAISPGQVTTYTYLGSPAWHYDDNELVKAAHRTWGQFRGYSQVEVRTGNTANQSNGVADKQTLTRTRYFRGMDQDNLPNSGRRTATVGNSIDATTLPDTDAFAGTVREVETFNGSGGAKLSTTLTDPVLKATTSKRNRPGLDPLVATVTGVVKTRTVTNRASGTPLTATTTNTLDDLGRVLQASVEAPGSDPSCTRRAYADNPANPPASNIRGLVTEQITSKQACPAVANVQTGIAAWTRTYYDHSTTLGQVPGAGDPTRVDTALDGSDTAPRFASTTTSYDALGRPTAVTDPVGGRTTTTYTPGDARPLTQVKVAKKLTANIVDDHVTTTTHDPGRGVVTASVDPAGRKTEASYDQLGRVTAVLRPGQVKGNTPATTTYNYLVRNNGPLAVTTDTLVDTGAGTSTTTSISILDAFGQTRQTQTETEGGRTVTDRYYDSHGWTIRANNRWYTNGAPGTTMVTAADSGIDSRTVTAYDGSGRATTTTDYQGLTAKTTAKTVYGGDRTTVLPPAGGTPSTTITDALGRTIEVLRYTTAPTVTGDVVTGGAPVSAKYRNDALGRQEQLTDAKGYQFTTTYDLGGRVVTKDDPDAGLTTSTYDDAGRMTTVTGARGEAFQQHFTYDLLGRKTKEEVGPDATKTVRATWVYDTLQKGQLTSSTSYQPAPDGTTAAYVNEVTGYSTAGLPTGSRVRIPTDGTLASDYVTSSTWTSTGLPLTTQVPEIGGLPGETLTTTYNPFGKPTTTSTGTFKYVTGTTYSPYFEATQYSLNEDTPTWITLTRDVHNRRLSKTNLSAQIAVPQFDETTYGYDLAGNVTSIRDVRGTSTAPVQHECYRYDLLGQLTTAWSATDQCATTPSTSARTKVGGAVPYFHEWSINNTGSRTKETRYGTTATSDIITNYTNFSDHLTPVAGKPQHALDVLKNAAGATTGDYDYDAAGNTTTRVQIGGDQSLEWDSANKLTKISTTSGPNAGKSSTYVYDANGGQLIRRDTGTTTLFLGGQEITRNTSTGATTGTRYYSHNGQTLAMRVGTTKLAVLYADHHGSNKIALDWYTFNATRRTLDPYGNEIGTTAWGPWPDNHGFLDKPTNTQTGLIDIGARKYDPKLGRFLSVDPVIDAKQPAQWNGYNYANNTPTTLSDPTGLRPLDEDRDWYANRKPPVVKKDHMQAVLFQAYWGATRAYFDLQKWRREHPYDAQRENFHAGFVQGAADMAKIPFGPRCFSGEGSICRGIDGASQALIASGTTHEADPNSLAYFAGGMAVPIPGAAAKGGPALLKAGDNVIAAEVGMATRLAYRKTFELAYPGIDMSKLVVHHAVEQQVLKLYPGRFGKYELHSIENLRGVPRVLNSELHLRQIRGMWDAFYDEYPNASRSQILEYAGRVDTEVGSLFVPPRS